MTDGPGWLGYFFFLGLIVLSGVLAIITAFFMRGFFNVLYGAGVLAIASAVSYIPLSLKYNADVWHLAEVDKQEDLAGRWKTDYMWLYLDKDSTYKFGYDLGQKGNISDSGRWTYRDKCVCLSTNDSLDQRPWPVFFSDGFEFIRFENQDNPDAWSGDLGLMREADWDSTH